MGRKVCLCRGLVCVAAALALPFVFDSASKGMYAISLHGSKSEYLYSGEERGP